MLDDALTMRAGRDDRVRMVAVTELADRAQFQLPLPGRGGTAQRWRALAELAADDLDLARLAEAHLDALAILQELREPPTAGSPAPPVRSGQRWAVWAAEPPNGLVQAEQGSDGGWRLTGIKRWCSGAHACTHALVTAHAPDGGRLFAVDLSGGGVCAGSGGRALGPRPLATDAAHSRRVTDLAVYLRQSHAERDFAVLGNLAAGAAWWQLW